MEASRKEFGHLKHFDLEEIKSITNDFDNNKVIGEGGFGKVYNGVLSDSDGQIMVAFKRLDRKYGQGDPEFLKEILMLSTYTHENLISLLGFCDEAGEKILVYEHASRGSLDRHLSSTTLTWTQRLKICLGAAKALCYLHDPKGTQERVIHRDIKSSNILLDDNWNAKVSDMGLSKVGPANQPQTFLATKVAGTPVYIDPDYMETNILTKESDVYSFGVVLFEVLCGRLCCEYNNNHFQSLVPKWKKNYKRETLDDFIFHDLKKGMDRRSLKTFSNIAYQCLRKSHEYRPKMSYVVEKLELALRFQPADSSIVAESEEKVKEFEEKVKTAVNKDELLSNGIIINGGNTWFSLNKNGERCEMISAECFYSYLPLGYSCNYFSRRNHDYVPYDGENKSRFEVRNRTGLDSSFDAHVRTQFLSPHITFKVNLVFKYLDKREDCLGVAYKLADEKNYSTMLLAHERGDGWSIGELYEFVSDTKNVDLEFLFSCNNPIEVEGIEFVPLEKVQHELLLEDEDVEMQTETYWEQKLPSDYEDIIKWSVNTLQWTTKKQLYSIFCEGFLINDGEEWFSLAKNGKKCHMLSATLALDIPEHRWDWEYLSESRFGEVAIDPVVFFRIHCRSSILSPQTTYVIYLVYKLQENHSWFELPIRCRNYVHYQYEWCIYLLSPQAPVIAGEFYNKKCLPQQRNDGWMEVRIYEFKTDTERISIDFPALLDDFNSLRGLIVQGIEFKPV